MYETEIAHIFDEIVILIAQNISDIPSEMVHHRSLIYINIAEGIQELIVELISKLSNYCSSKCENISF
jgi:hypothetical protein